MGAGSIQRKETQGPNFHTYKFDDYKEQVIDLLKRVCTVSVRTMGVIKQMGAIEVNE